MAGGVQGTGKGIEGGGGVQITRLGVMGGSCKKIAVLPHGPSSSFWSNNAAAGQLVPELGGMGGSCKKLAAILRGPGSSCWADNTNTSRLDVLAWSGNHQRQGPLGSRHPLMMQCLLG